MFNGVAPNTPANSISRGLFVTIHAAIEKIGAKRVVLDTLETLFSELADQHTFCVRNCDGCSNG